MSRRKTKAAGKALADRLREGIEQSGLTRYEIAKRTGVPESSLGRFVYGRINLSLDNAEAVMKLLGWRVIEDPKTRR